MTSFEGLSVIVTGLSVLGSERKETTSWPPYRPISALLSKSSSLGFSTGFCKLSGLAHSAAAARRAARSRSRQLVMRPFPPVLRSGWISDQYGFHPLVKSVCQRRVSEKERHQREPRKEHPPVRGKHVILLEAGQHITPAWHRFSHSQSEKRQSHLSKDVLRHEDSPLGQQHAKRLRQHMAAQQIGIRRPKALRSAHVVPFARAQDHAAHQPRRARPPDQADDDNQQQKRLLRTYLQRQECTDGKQQIQPGQHEEKLCAAHQRFVRPAAVEAGYCAQHRSEEHTSELQSRQYLVCRLLLEKKKKNQNICIQ